MSNTVPNSEQERVFPATARPRIGLALSCGGAKALAHIGVIQVLEENGVHIDAVAGTSMGSYVGALFAYGHDGRHLQELAEEIDGRWKLWRLADPSFPPRRGFVKGRRVKRLLKRSIGGARFSELKRELRIVATSLDSLERKVIDRGKVVDAVHASCAMPGVCVPVEMRDGVEYIDGGVSDPLPVDVLREMGMDRVIAVNTIPAPHHREARAMRLRKRGAGGGILRSAGRLLNRHLNYFAEGNLLDILLNSATAAQMRVAVAASRDADVVIRPVSCDGTWSDYSNHARYIALGRSAALNKLAELEQLTLPAAVSNPLQLMSI